MSSQFQKHSRRFRGNCSWVGNTANKTVEISIISFFFFTMSSKSEKYGTNSMSRVRLEDLIVSHFLENFSDLYGTLKIISVFIQPASHWT